MSHTGMWSMFVVKGSGGNLLIKLLLAGVVFLQLLSVMLCACWAAWLIVLLWWRSSHMCVGENTAHFILW